MKREDKQDVVKALADQMTTFGNFYIADTADLTVESINAIRRKCFEKGITVKVAKNTLIRKAMESAGVDSEELKGILKGSSTLFFSEIGSAPAKLMKELRKTGPKPVLKGAYIDSSVFVGDNQIDVLASLKSKDELIGEIIGLLQSPVKNVVSALQSGGNTLGGLVKTLQEREG